MWYFGCWKEAGHYLWETGGWKVIGKVDDVVDPNKLDGSWAPRELDPAEDERAVATHYVGGYTIIAMWDRSVDRRFGSNSVFVERGRLSEGAMWDRAEKQFPQIVIRLAAYQARQRH